MTRVSGFGALASAAGVAGGVGLALAETAAAIDSGPCLSLRSSISTPCFELRTVLASVLAQLCGLVSTKLWATWPLTPPEIAVTDRAIG